MSEWSQKVLKELVEVDPEQLPSSTDANYSFYYIDISSVTLGKIDYPTNSIRYKESPSRARKILKDNDILMSSVRPNLKAFAKFKKRTGKNYIASTGFAVLRARANVDIGFIYHSLFSNEIEKQIETYVVGSNYPAINSGDVRNLKINIPSLPAQQKLSNILDTCDSIIEQTQSSIAKYKAIKQGLLHDLFTRGLDANGHLRPRYQDAPELYKESELGMIPKEWEVKRLDTITTKIGDGIHTTPLYVESSAFRFINGNNLINGNIYITEKTNCVSIEEYNKHKIDLNDRTILMSINGTIGNLAYYRNEKVILGKSSAYVSCNYDVEVDYIFHLLGTDRMIKYFTDELTGSTIKNLSLASIRKAPILFPRIEEQKGIVKILNNLDNKLRSEETLLQKHQSIKKGLMSNLLGGKKEVSAV